MPEPQDLGRRRRIVIVGAAGRDFHNFNVAYRADPRVEVVAFTAAQIPGIEGRRYPASLAGPHHPDGIPIVPEAALDALVREREIDTVVFAYSDVRQSDVMHLAARALAAGADFKLLGPRRTMLPSRVPVIAVSAVRTGSGKSQTSRWLGAHLRERGYRVAVLRHPMPYGDLAEQAVQRFATRADLDTAHCTLEEREEYEPHLAAGTVVFSGIDWEAILLEAEKEAEIMIWDGGNNDFPFVRPALHIVLFDALRPGQASEYHPGETVARMADVIIISKVHAASAISVQRALAEARQLNPHATIVRAASPVTLDQPAAVAGKRVLVVEDGPTVTHGGMAYGAGYVAATEGGAAAIVDPRQAATPAIRAVFDANPHLHHVLPALGYRPEQLAALRETINNTRADVVVAATPVDLAALIEINKPVVRARYTYADAGEPTLASVVQRFLATLPVAAT